MYWQREGDSRTNVSWKADPLHHISEITFKVWSSFWMALHSCTSFIKGHDNLLSKTVKVKLGLA